MTAYAVLTRRFLLEYGRNPVNLLVLVLVPVVFVLVAAEPMADAAELLGGTGLAVEIATTGWAAAFLAALAMYFQTRQARSADRRLVLAGVRVPVLVGARISTGLAIAAFVSAAALGTLFLRGEVDDPLRVIAGTLMFAVVYVGIGAAVGAVVRDPVNGTVVILLIWILDVFFGPALTSPDRVELTRWMPTHFITLWMVDLPSGHGGRLGDLGLALVWVAASLIGSWLLLARATRTGRRSHPQRRPGWLRQATTGFRLGFRQYRRNAALWVLLVTVPIIFIWLSKLITEEQFSVMRVIDDGRDVDLRYWLPDTHAGTMAPIAVASLATVAGLFIALNNRDGDRRLVLAGVHRSALLTSRFAEVGVAVLVTSAASLAVTAMVFQAEQWGAFIGGILLLGVVYGLFGMCLGFLLDRVSGVLIAFVVPFLDLGITQSPMLRLEPPGPAVLLPGYGPYRLLIDAGLTKTFDETEGLLIGLAWVLGLTLIVTLVFTARTRVEHHRAHPRHAHGERHPAAAT
ncbi:ABC transporter permease [Agromyces sp. H66]|uniref:ABC transporter permease n=1 Tax=Agromyces sp. H66 TaxID=2529859 RepID=UPI0010AAFB1C|nr:ABC transporter permease [Agromyces sp. H66]